MFSVLIFNLISGVLWDYGTWYINRLCFYFYFLELWESFRGRLLFSLLNKTKMINNLHHFEILTNSSSKLLSYLMKGFKFNLTMTKETDMYRQYLLDLNSMRFLITSLKGGGCGDSCGPSDESQLQTATRGGGNYYQSSLKTIASSDRSLFDTIRSKSNTVFNAAFQVKDLDRIIYNCQK